jgi:hypothetical protein
MNLNLFLILAFVLFLFASFNLFTRATVRWEWLACAAIVLYFIARAYSLNSHFLQ